MYLHVQFRFIKGFKNSKKEKLTIQNEEKANELMLKHF